MAASNSLVLASVKTLLSVVGLRPIKIGTKYVHFLVNAAVISCNIVFLF